MRDAPLALSLGFIQFFFAITWTAYAVFLPELLADAGLDPSYLLIFLLADQIIFAIMDPLLGAFADDVAKLYSKVGPALVTIVVFSGVTFTALPWFAGAGPEVLVVALFCWAAASSVLRAPPLALLNRHVRIPEHPVLAGLALSGLGLAGALAPYLSGAMSEMDPLLPFAAATLGLCLAAAGLAGAESRRQKATPPPAPATPPRPRRGPGAQAHQLKATNALGLGFQLHAFVRMAPLFLQFSEPDALGALMPLFWGAFSVVIGPSGLVMARLGATAQAAIGAWIFVLGLLIAGAAGGTGALVVGELIAGAGWAMFFLAGIAAAVEAAPPSWVGLGVGAFFGALSAASALRFSGALSGFIGEAAGGTVDFLALAAAAAGGLALALAWASGPVTARDK